MMLLTTRHDGIYNLTDTLSRFQHQTSICENLLGVPFSVPNLPPRTLTQFHPSIYTFPHDHPSHAHVLVNPWDNYTPDPLIDHDTLKPLLILGLDTEIQLGIEPYDLFVELFTTICFLLGVNCSQ